MGQECQYPSPPPSSLYYREGEEGGGAIMAAKCCDWGFWTLPLLPPNLPFKQFIKIPFFPVLWLSIFLSFYNKAWDSKHIQCLGGRPLLSNMLDLWALYEPDCFSQNSTSISSIFTLAKYSGRRRRFKYLWQILLKFTPVHSKLNQTVGS